MKMIGSPEASFDALFLLTRMRTVYSDLHSWEIHTLIYLAQLLSVYEGLTPHSWGYYFVSHDLGGPFSSEVAEALKAHVESGEIAEVAGPHARYEILEQGTHRLAFLAHLTRFEKRQRYLDAAADAGLNRPLPSLMGTIRLEPMLQAAERLEQRRTLVRPSPDLDDVYDQFFSLKNALGKAGDDIWLAGLIWLDYLGANDVKERLEEDHGR